MTTHNIDELPEIKIRELAETKLLEKNFKDALKYFQKALEKTHSTEEGEQVYLHTEIGKVKKELGDIKGACEEWKIVYELDYVDADKFLVEFCGLKAVKHSDETWGLVAEEKIEEEEYEEAIYYINQAIKSYPEESLNYSIRGEAKLGIKDYKGAIEDFTQTLQMEPNGFFAVEVYFNRGRLTNS